MDEAAADLATPRAPLPSASGGVVLEVGQVAAPKRPPSRVGLHVAVGFIISAGVWLMGLSGFEGPLPPVVEPRGKISSAVSMKGVKVRYASSMQSRPDDELAAGEAGVTPLCDADSPLQVLFIGNSYTFYHDMPKTVAEIASSAGCQLEVAWATSGGYRLELHAQSAVTLAAIHERSWDVVVLQNQSQQPAYKPEHVREETLPIVEQLADEIYENNPRTDLIYYTTWGRLDGDRTNCDYNAQVCTFEGHTDALESGYELYASETEGRLARVGHAFSMIARDSGAPVTVHDLYDPDGTHPSLRGSYLAAAIFFYEITGVTPEGLGYPSYLTAYEAAYLQQIAALTVRGEDIEPPFASVVTRESLLVRCDPAVCPLRRGFDKAPTRVELFSGSCSDFYLRTEVERVAAVDIPLACSAQGCTSGALNVWAREGGERIPPGDYSVYALIDLDRSGGPTPGDVESCETAFFEIGHGKPRVLASLAAYTPLH